VFLFGLFFLRNPNWREICRFLPAIVDEWVHVESDPVEKGCFTSTTSGRDEQCLYPVVYKDIVLVPGTVYDTPTYWEGSMLVSHHS